jgi:DNA-binding LacI/PurR family transcriptional regulator
MALGAVKALTERGLGVPGDISVAGCDNISLSRFTCPALTTLNIPRERIGQMVFDALSPEPSETVSRGREIVIDPDLIIRESTGPAPIEG